VTRGNSRPFVRRTTGTVKSERWLQSARSAYASIPVNLALDGPQSQVILTCRFAMGDNDA